MTRRGQRWLGSGLRCGAPAALVAALVAAMPGLAVAQGAVQGAGMSSAQGAGAAVPLALVISNSNYAALPKLPGCEMSANLVASVLSRAGFKVIRQTNPSNARLGTAIASLGDDMAGTADSRSMIYICGYVASFSDRLFLVPVEARLEREADVLSQGIVARLLMSSVAGSGSQAGLVLMDVATVPDQKGAPSFESMLRPSDAAHGGLAVARVPATESQGPAPLATALADLVAGGRLEVGAALSGLKSQGGTSRNLLLVRPPAHPSWLLGDAPAAVPVAAAPPPSSAAGPAATAAPALMEPNAAERRRLQLALQRLGYFKGRVSGVFGPDTLAAIRQFQKDSDAEPTGRLTARQGEQLLQ